MSDRILNPQMARTAQRDEVARIIGDIGNKEIAATIDVVDIERSALALTAAKTASLVALKNCEPDALPMSAELERLAAAPVCVSGSHGRALRAFVRTELASTLFFAGKSAEGLSAMVAGQFPRGHKALITALKRAVANIGMSLAIKRSPADCAGDHRERIFLAILRVTCGIAKFQLGILFHNVAWSLKGGVAVRADECGAVNHRCRVTCLTAEFSLGKVGIKLIPAMRARLGH